MVAHVLRLRLALLVGALQGSRTQRLREAGGLVVLVATTAVACWALTSLRGAPLDVLSAVTVLGGGVVTLGFGLAPLVGGIGDQLDPRRFAVVAVGPVRLAAVLALASVVSLPAVGLAVTAGFAAAAWIARGVSAGTAIAGTVLGVVTCLLLARVAMALTALFLRERRTRELSGLFALAILVIVVPTAVFLASLEWHGRVPYELADAIEVLGQTPIGAAWAYPAAVASSAPWSGVSLSVAIATVVLLAGVWVLLVRRALSVIERPPARARGRLGWFAVAPGTPVGAVAARSLVYWYRDPRYLVNLGVVPVAALLATVPLMLAGVPAAIVALVPVPFVALFLGWLPHNDVAYDSTGVWMHVSSGLSGFADRIGRLIPILLLGIPLLAVSYPIALSVHGDWGMLPVLVGVSASLFLAGLGLSSIASVVAPYPVPRPGESPFQQPQRTGASALIAQAAVLGGAIVISIPALLWGWQVLAGNPAAGPLAMWGGLAIGLVTLAIGVAIGAAAFARRGDRIMEFAETS